MPEWIPTRSSAKGRLVLEALSQFAATDFDEVGVSDLCADAGVTTGSLYHHFGSKLGLYDVVRTDVERRVVDRLRGAVAARPADGHGAAALAALVVAFDFLVDEGLARLLATAHPGRPHDPIDTCIAGVTDRDGVPIGSIIVAAWRAALRSVTDGVEAPRVRAALAAISVDEPTVARRVP